MILPRVLLLIVVSARSVETITEDGNALEFADEVEGRRVSDRSGAKWDLLTGRGSEGRTLKPIPHLNVYWFAWADFYPETLIYEP